MVDFMEIVVSFILQEVLRGIFSAALEKRKEKVSQGKFLERIQKSVNDMKFALEKTRKLPITDISLLRRRKEIVDKFTEGRCLLIMYEQQQKLKNQPVTRYSVRESITGHATKFSFLPLLGFSKERLLSSSDARVFERHADSAAKFLRDVKFGCSLWHHTFCRPFIRHLLEGKSLRCEIVKNRSQSISFYMRPMIMEGRGVEVRVCYEYNNSRKLEECICLNLRLRISEDTDIIGTTIKCMQQLTSPYKLVAETAIGELKLLPNLQDIFHTYVDPSSFVDDEYVCRKESFRPDPICCNGNSYRTLPEPVIWIHFSCYISAPGNSLRNAPLVLTSSFAPHYSSYLNYEKIMVGYGGKTEFREGSVQQLEEIARSDAVNYLVHDPEPTSYTLFWSSPHGVARVTLRLDTPRRSRKVSKRKRPSQDQAGENGRSPKVASHL